ADLRRIHHSGLTLLNLVNDILDISKIESGKFELISGEYDLASVINDTVAINLPRIGDKPVRFFLSVDPTLPSRLIGDDLRIKQILKNLLSNAFKYTMEGEVDLSCTGWREETDVLLCFKVSDTGIGIKQKDQAKLFSDYSQMESRKNKAIEGTGLGLSITKRLVELMGGTIQVDSRHGRGSTFTVTIRQKALGSPPLGEKVAMSLESRWPSRIRDMIKGTIPVTPIPYGAVLVVDDVPANIDVVRGVLKPYQMTVDSAGSGREAIALVRSGKIKYDAIFLDQMMPDLDGIETFRAIRNLPGEYARKVPIIALTANAIVGNEQKLLAEGFQAFMSKPIDLKHLDELLRQFVSDPEREAEYKSNMSQMAKEVEREVETALSAEENNRAERALALATAAIRARVAADEMEASRSGSQGENALGGSPSDTAPLQPAPAIGPDGQAYEDGQASEEGAGQGDYLQEAQALSATPALAAVKLLTAAKSLKGERGKAAGKAAEKAAGKNGGGKAKAGRGPEGADGLGPSQASPDEARGAPGGREAYSSASSVAAPVSLKPAPPEENEIRITATPVLSPPDYSIISSDLSPEKVAKDLEEIDLAEGLQRFSGNHHVYYDVLRSYRDSVNDLVGQLSNPNKDNLKNYTIVIHGLKSSSYGVCAKKIGRLAEDLELRAADGDLDYVRKNNPNFLFAVDRLMDSLGRFFDYEHMKKSSKPEKPEPDPAILDKLREACRTYDMDGVDSAISELDSYRYKGDPKLTDWLKDRAEVMDFKGILDRFPAA
ncbi:MAG: response regulator, partial [Deltaproteobacteria bacterium]|nr:response regulator [Deltaproteobacteria bacterium]